MKIANILICILLFLFSLNAQAYKEETHQDLSSKALKISDVATDVTLLRDLGLDDFEADQLFPSPSNLNDKKTIRDLLRDGAFFEDNFPRSLNHFFNPIDNTPLTVLGKEAGNTSPDWALEDNGDVDPDINGEQEYSYKEANDYFFKALTEPTEEAREENWGKLFQTLGQVIHHVQDMAQPQHVRNDEHLTDPSWYEDYSNGQKSEAHFIELMSGNAYPIPEFNTAREFWTTTGKEGIADFTNQNFVSNDTNFNIKDNTLSTNALFDLPAPLLTRNTETLTNLLNDGGKTCQELLDTGPIDLPVGADCIIEFIETSINDNKNPTYNNVNMRAASLSLYDEYLDKYAISDLQIEPEENHQVDIDVIPTLNKFNYDAAHQYLIPRAVAYSAGLINHFFRGKIEFYQNADVGWVIKNVSGEPMNGTFTLFYDDVDGNRNQVTEAIWSLAEPLNNDSEFIAGNVILPADVKSLILVFTGAIGADNGSVTAKVVSRDMFVLLSYYDKYEEVKLAAETPQYFHQISATKERSIQIDLADYINKTGIYSYDYIVAVKLPLLSGTITNNYSFHTGYNWGAYNYPVVRLHSGKVYIYRVSGTSTAVGNPFRGLDSGNGLIELNIYSEEGTYTADYKGVGTQTLTITNISTLLGTNELALNFDPALHLVNKVTRTDTSRNYDAIIRGAVFGLGDFRVVSDISTVSSYKTNYSQLLDSRWDCSDTNTIVCTLNTLDLLPATKTSVTDNAFETLRSLVDYRK